MESLTNLTSLSFYAAFTSVAEENNIQLGEALYRSLFTGEIVGKKHYSRKKSQNIDAEKEKKQVIREFNKEVLPYIRILSLSSQWSDLAHYFLSLRFFTGIINNGLSRDLNRTIGMEMMQSLMITKNKYARRIVKFIHKK